MHALLDHDHDSASEEKSDTTMAGTFKATTCTNQCLASSPSPAVYPIDRRTFSPRLEAASAFRITGDNRTDITAEEGTRFIALGLNGHRGRRYGVS